MEKAQRNLDSYYFRVNRDGKWRNICFSDLTDEERNQVGLNKSAEWWKSFGIGLSDRIRNISDQIGLNVNWDYLDELWAKEMPDTEHTKNAYREFTLEMGAILQDMGETFNIRLAEEE